MQRMTKCFGPNHLPQIEVRPTCADNQVDKSPYPHIREEPAYTAGRSVDAE